jgi:hypothetical protein
MRGKATWVITAIVAAIVIVGVVDALRGSSSQDEPAAAAEGPTVVDVGGSTLTLESVTAQATTEPEATTEPLATTTAPAIPSPPPERLPRCTTPQLALAIKVVDGSAMLVLRRVAGKPCHHGRSPIGITVLDQSGRKVPMFGHGSSAPENSTAPANFTDGFVQLMKIPYSMYCDPAGSYLAVATVGPYEARRTVSGTEITCNHG